jgi:RNA polymerase sigma factor (sigma-70 family)
MPPMPTRPTPVAVPSASVSEGPSANPSETGASLLAGCQRGDERALARLIETYQERIYRLALRVCGDAALAEEAAVDSFYKIWSKSRQWRGQTGADTWMYRVTVRTVLDLRRGRRRWWQRLRASSLWDDEDPTPGPVDEALEREERQASCERLAQAMETLKPADRMLVHLYYDEEQTLAEIGEILDVPPENLKMRLARARKRLREALESQTAENQASENESAP